MMESYGEMRRLTDYAAAQIERLEADGVHVAPEAVLTIAAIGRLVESPSARLDLSRGRPVHIGGAVLWPLTLAGSDWFTRHQDALGSQQLCGLAYAMAHGREPLPESDVFKNVKRWSASLRCRVKELDEACQQVLAQDEQPAPANESDGGQTFGDLSAILTATCGGPPEMWEYQVSMRYANEVLTQKLAMMAEGDVNKARKMEHEKSMAAYVWSVRNGKA
jgi:hypothetical protein